MPLDCFELPQNLVLESNIEGPRCQAFSLALEGFPSIHNCGKLLVDHVVVDLMFPFRERPFCAGSILPSAVEHVEYPAICRIGGDSDAFPSLEGHPHLARLNS